MRIQEPASPTDVLGLGIAFAAGGGYFILVAMGVLPQPSESVARAPTAIIVAIGLAFLFAGLTCVVRARVGATALDSDLPAGAPRWARLSYRALAIGTAGALATIGAWIAIGSGPRLFGGSIDGLSPAGETIGRAVFALGTVIALIYVLALTVGTVRKFFGRSGG